MGRTKPKQPKKDWRDAPLGDIEEMDIISSSGASFKDIVMSQYQKITTFCNVEFRGGFYTTVTTKEGEDKLVYVQDTRETFSNAVLIMAIILRPKFDKDMKRYFKIIRLKLKKAEKKFFDATSVEETSVLGENFYKEEKDKILLYEYKNQKLFLYMKLFSKICEVLDKMNYFEILGATF